MAQPIKCLSHKYEDMSSDPQHSLTEKLGVMVHVYNPTSGGGSRDRKTSKAGWPASLANG